MVHAALSLLDNVPELRIRQQKEWGEILSGWETRNRYVIEDGRGQALLHAGETGGGLGAFLTRSFLRGWRPFTLEVRDAAGATVMTVRRPWRWFFARAEFSGPQGEPLGAVERLWSLLTRRYRLEDAHGVELGEVVGPLFRPWTFRLMVSGREVGGIRKRWSGMLKEAFSDADNFSLELAPDAPAPLRAVALGATFLIDFVHFERSN